MNFNVSGRELDSTREYIPGYMTSYNYNNILLLSLSISHIDRRRVAQCNSKALVFCRGGFRLF